MYFKVDLQKMLYSGHAHVLYRWKVGPQNNFLRWPNDCQSDTAQVIEWIISEGRSPNDAIF